LLNFTQVKVLQSDVYLSKSTEVLVLKVLEYQEYKSKFSKYCITTTTVPIFMYKNVLHGVRKNVRSSNGYG